MNSVPRHRPLWVELLIATALLAIFGGVTWLVLSSDLFTKNQGNVWAYRGPIVKAWWVTVGVSTGCLLLATILAVLLVMGQRAGSIVLRRFCQGYIEIMRGSPLLVQLYIGYFVVAVVLNIDEPIVMGIYVLAWFSAAYLAEIIRGGLESVAASQRQAADAVGFTTWQAYRYVIIPQTVRRIMPGVAGEFANLIKNSSLLSVISITEFTKELNDAKARTLSSVAVYFPMAVGYLILTIPIAFLARYLERRFAYDS